MRVRQEPAPAPPPAPAEAERSQHSGVATDTSQYPVAEPYPPVRVAAANPYYAGLLADAAFARESEMTAITEYTYYAVMTDNAELKQIFLAFARDEMIHLYTLMQLIRMLGRDPRAWDANYTYWCGDAPYYGMTDCDRLAKVHSDEIGAAANYRSLAATFGDPCLKAIMERIAKDEDQHARISGEWMQRCCGYPPGR